ncbi:MAG: hypothetical protein H7Y17_17005 [Chlorobia bacterium]|nr:hypothetical protein [Fimbriimonadaceae bacterium]
MKFKTILSAFVVASMVGASISPALADDDRGRGKKNGHYKNGKSSGNHPSQRSKHDRDRDDDRNRRGDDRRDDDRNRNSNWDRDRWDNDGRNRSNSDYNWNQSNQNRSNSNLDRLSDQRQKTKNEWRNIAYVSGGVALLGLLQKDNRLVFAGAAGTLYSLYRYEQDRKSQSGIDRLRATYFSRSSFERDGRQYDRRLVTKNGDRYYQFVRR